MKKVYITEKQAQLIVNYVKSEKTIDESWKEVVLSVALLAGINLTGHNKAQAQSALEDEKVLTKVQSVLQDDRLSKVVDSLDWTGGIGQVATMRVVPARATLIIRCASHTIRRQILLG